MSAVSIREFSYPEDYHATLALWKSMEKGLNVGPSDAPDEIRKKLERDGDLFLVAATDTRIVGTVIGGFDGRRGFVYHLAVAMDFRRNGLGRKLMGEVEQRLRSKGCIRCFLFVRPDNPEAQGFYEGLGWQALDDVPLAKNLA